MEIVILQSMEQSRDIMRAKGMLTKWASLTLDIETKGNFKDPFSLEVVMLQLGNVDTQIVVDAREVDILPFLKIIKDKLIVGHNLKFDVGVIYNRYGVRLENLWDTMLATMVVECGDQKGPFTLEAVTRRYMNPFAYSNQMELFTPFATKKVRDTFSKVEGEFSPEQVAYGALDVKYAHGIHKILKKRIKKEKLTDTLQLELEYLNVVIDLERNGVYVDPVEWMELADTIKKETEDFLLKLKEQYDINWNSPKQVIGVFKSLGIKTTAIDKVKMIIKDSVNVNVISKQKNTHPLVKLYIDYKMSSKKSSSYGEKYLRFVNPTTGRVHTSIWQILETGRTAALDPNVYQIPRDSRFRHCFKAPDGYVFVKADFKNQELRILADKANEKGMLGAFINDRDIHLETARLAFENPLLDKESEERQIAKNMNFLMAYGGGPKKLADNYGLSIAQAKALIRKYYDQFSSLEQYFFKVRKDALRRGYILIDEVIGRKSYIENFDKYLCAKAHVEYFERRNWEPNPKIEEYYKTTKAKIERDAQNRPIQGTGANMSKWTGVLLYKYLKTDPGRFKMVLMPHDEWVLECKAEDGEYVKKLLEDTMLEASKRFCTLLTVPADGLISTYWKK